MTSTQDTTGQDTLENPPQLLRDKLDWLLLWSGVCLLPWCLLFCMDMGFRTDFRFFPLMIVATLAWTFRHGRLAAAPPSRWFTSLGLWIGGGAVGLLAGFIFSPWLAAVGWLLCWLAWTLARMGKTAWTRVASWSLPMASLLLLPLSEASDPLYGFVQSVTLAASSILDLLSIPHLPQATYLELRSASLDVSAVCRGLGNPYLLGALTILYCLVRHLSWVVGLLLVLSVPVWSWGSSVCLVAIGCLLSENLQIFVLAGYRLWILQALFLVLNLGAIVLLHRALLVLFSPFMAEYEGVGGWHKLFNAVVLWPEPDPLRKRKLARTVVETLATTPRSSSQRPRVIVLTAAAVTLLLSGLVGYLGLNSSRGTLPTVWQLALSPHMQVSQVQQLTQPESLPEELSGLKLVGFDALPTPPSSNAHAQAVRWTYAAQSYSVQLEIRLPLRGFYPRERWWLALGGKELESRKPVSSLKPNAEYTGLLDELTIEDPVAGRSYVAYATWSPDGPLSRDCEVVPGVWSRKNVSKSLRYQPTTISLSLFVTGTLPADEAERAQFQQILIDAVEALQAQQ